MKRLPVKLFMPPKESSEVNRIVGAYNMVPNLFWSALCLIPIAVFCYRNMPVRLFVIFLAVSLLVLLLPKLFFDKIQLGTTIVIYKKIGVRVINRFTQNGDIVNGIIRGKFPQYKVVANRKQSIQKLLNQTYLFEKFHFILLVFFLLTIGYAFLNNYLVWSLVLTISNLLYNVYPAFLQQYIRIRLTAMKKKNSIK